MKSTNYFALVLAVAVIGGCKSEPTAKEPTPKEQARQSEHFPADDADRPVWRILESQTAAAAAEDGMLYAHHFQGGELNDLGRDKLDLMSRSEMRPLVVYVNVSDDANSAARQEAVTRFLSTTGMEADAMMVKAGPNPGPGAATAEVLANRWKIESPGPVAGAADETKSLVTPPAGVGATGGTNYKTAQ